MSNLYGMVIEPSDLSDEMDSWTTIQYPTLSTSPFDLTSTSYSL